MHSFLDAATLVLAALLPTAGTPSPGDSTTFIRVNQLGYLPDAVKVAVACALDSTAMGSFSVENETGRTVFGPRRAESSGAFGPCARTYRLDFSSLRAAGRYRIVALASDRRTTRRITSSSVRIGASVYDGTADTLLHYMRQQRSGWNPLFGDSVHTHDGIIVDSPRAGQFLPVSGGWADASDYLQYVTTSANATYVMLMAYRDFPHAFSDAFDARGVAGANGVPDVVDEARHGLAWLERMFPNDSEMYNQLADDRDHAFFDLPVNDSSNYGWGKGKERPVYPCTGRPQGLFQNKNRSTGWASTAGKYAAAFALASLLDARSDPGRAETLRRKALAAYLAGRSHPGVCQTAPSTSPYFYEEDNWVDDMELGAAELSWIGDSARFVREGAEYAAREPVTPWMGADTARHYQWYPWHNNGHYELWRRGSPAVERRMAENYRRGLEAVVRRAGNGFRVGIPFIWCSNNLMTSFATQAYLYRRMTGDQRFRVYEAAAIDWIFGTNPWGVSMVIGLPHDGVTARDPHSAVASRLGVDKLLGGLLDGPVYRSIYQNLRGIGLHEPDEYAPFNTGFIVYHDDIGDYSTNEPIMDGTANLTYLLAALSSAGAPARRAGDASSPGAARDALAARGTLAPARSPLHQSELVPAPDLFGVTGRLELSSAPTPFGIAVTADGRPRWRASATISGLPSPASLGSYAGYVAWLYDVSMTNEVRLGPVGNGRSRLGGIDRNQFRLVITAERSPDVATRSGRIVLRATSPSALLLAHRDLVQPAAPGLARPPMDDASTVAMDDMAGHAAHGAATWTMPAMPLMTPMPGMHALRPTVAPWSPRVPEGATVVDARPQSTIDLRDGDTLVLDATFVRRTLGGRTLLMYGFNGEQPGPLLRVRQRATVVVRFRNHIDQPSSVHWHGIRLDNAFDGVPGVTQAEVLPDSEYVYRVHFPDAGIYWYHPHVREDVQQELGLYGNMLVMPADTRWYGAAHREEVLALDDLLANGDGAAQFGGESPTHALMGRWGNVLLVNGEPRWSLRVRRGEVVRFFLTNVSNARLFNVSFAGARMKVVATDGGRLEREEWVESVPIAPAERWVVEVRFDRPGRVALVNRVQSLDHMYGTYVPATDTMGEIRVDSARVSSDLVREFARLRRNADVVRELARFRSWISRPPDRALVLDLRVRSVPQPVSLMLNGLNVPADWNDGMAMANWATSGREVTWILRDAATGRENMDIDWVFALGEVAKIRIYNNPLARHAMAHPIHVHGQRMLVLARNGVASENLAWKDTAIIPAGETVDVLVEMTNPGRWALHCHVAEHMGAGMMSVFTVR